MRILFMGTPDFAAEILKTLHEQEEIVGVFTQPGKPKGRGHNVTPSPVQVLAEELGLSCYTPATLRDGSALELMRELKPDLSVVVAYGKILPKDVLEFPRYGSVNIHASLLPRFRGAAPIQRAIIAGDRETGVTVQQMDEGLDTGDMLVVDKVTITPEDDFGTLHDKLIESGKRAIVETIKQIKEGILNPVKQPEEGAIYAAKIEKADAIIDFSKSSTELSCLIRGLSPIPMAQTKLGGKILKIASVRVVEYSGTAAPGTIIKSGKDGIVVACGDGALELIDVVPEGKRRMSATEFARGHAGIEGEVMSWQ